MLYDERFCLSMEEWLGKAAGGSEEPLGFPGGRRAGGRLFSGGYPHRRSLLPLRPPADLEPRGIDHIFVVAGVGPEVELEFLRLADVGPLLQADLAVRDDDDGGIPLHGTALLAVPAAVAPRGDHHGPPIPVDWPKYDGVVRADLITDQAELILSPDQALLLAQDGRPDLRVVLLLQGDGTDRLGRAYPAAYVAVRLAGCHPELRLWRPEALKARLPQAGLEGVGHTGFHAFPAADAGSEELGFGKRPGRPDELPPPLEQRERALERDKPQGQSPAQRGDSPPAREVEAGILAHAGKGGGIGDRLLRADPGALPALDAFGRTGGERVFGDRSHGAGLLAGHAAVALRADPAPKEPEWRNQAQQRAQGAEIAAPEPRRQAAQGHNPPEDEERQRRHVKDGLRVAQMGEADPAQGSGERPQGIEEKVRDRHGQGVQDKGIKPGQECDRVEEIDQRDPRQRRGDDQDEEDVFRLPQARLPLQPRPAGLPEEEGVEAIDCCTQRAEVGAEEPADGQGRTDEDERPEDAADHLPRGDDGGEPDQRVDPQVYVSGEPFGEPVGGQQEQQSEQDQRQRLDCSSHTVLLWIRSFSTSICPTPRW